MIAFPPCTYLAKAQMFRYSLEPGRIEKRDKAVAFVHRLFHSGTPQVAIENPVGYLNNNWRKPTDILYPHNFGSPYHKEICLWLKNLPPLMRGPYYSGKRKHMANHVNSRMSQALKSKIKSKFFPEVAKAMAAQWS